MASRARILLRILFASLTVIGAAALLALLTPWPAEFLRKQVLQQAAAVSGGDVSIGSLEIHFFPPRLILKDIRMERRDAGGGELRFACREADLSLPYRAYRGRLDRVEALDFQGPTVDYRRGGGAVAPAPPGSGVPLKPFLPVSFGRISVEDGLVRVTDPRTGFETALEGVRASASSNGLPPGVLEGSLEPARVFLRLNEHDLSGEVGGDFRIAGREIGFADLEAKLEGGFAASGDLGLDFRTPTPGFRVDVRASLEAREEPRPVLRDLHGDVRVQATGSLGGEGPRLEGSFSSESVTLERLTAKRARGRLAYRDRRLAASQVEAEVFGGGKLNGESVMDWGADGGGAPDLSATVAVDGASAEEILAWVGQPGIPVTGRVTHRATYRLRGMDPESLEAEGEVSLVGTLRAGDPEPLTGSARLSVSKGLVTLQPAVASTGTLKASFRGTVPLRASGSGEGRLEVATTRLSRLAFLLAQAPPALRMPLDSIVEDSAEADAAWRGNLAWRGGEPSLSGDVSAGPLSLDGSDLGNLEAHLTARSGSVQVDQLELSGGDVTATAAVSWRSDGTIRLQGEAGNVASEWIQEWAGLDYPVRGRLTAEFDLTGSVSRPEGTVSWRLDEPRILDIPFNAAEGDLVLRSEAIEIIALRVGRGEGEMSLSGEVGLDGRPISLDAQGHDLDLGWIYEAGIVAQEISGPVEMSAHLGGTLESWELEAQASTPGATLRGFETGAVRAQFSADPAMGALTVVPELPGMNFAGRILWDERLSFDGDLLLKDFLIPVAYLGQEIPVSDFETVLSGGIRVEGQLRHPARFDAFGNLVKVSVRLGSITLVSQVPAFFRWEAPRLEITPLRLAGSGSDLTLTGLAEPEAGTYHFSAEGTVGLPALASFYPGLQATGTGMLSAAFDVTPQGSRLSGWGAVTGGRLRGAGLPMPITDLEGRVVLDESSRFHLEEVHFTSGGGSLTMQGEGKLRGFLPDTLQLGLKGQNVQLAYPEGFRGRYDLDLALAYDPTGGRLSGDVHLIRGVYSKDFQIERSLFSLGDGGEDFAVAEEEDVGEGPISQVALDLDLRAERGLWILNDLAKLEARANLHVGGTVGAPELTGRLSAFEGSIIRFRQVEYEVTRGNIDLVDLDRFNPYFDIAATTRVQDYDIFLRLDGSLEHLEYELTSNPALSQQDILALLVSGRTLESLASTQGGQQSLEEAAAQALTGGLASGLGGTIQGVTRLDEFSIDPVVMGREGDPASRIRVGKQISENLSAAYSTLLGSSSEEIYQLNYKIGRDFRLTSTRESDGAIGGDLRYVWRRKTGPAAGPQEKPELRRIRSLTVEGDPELTGWRLKRLYRLEAGDAMDRGRVNAGEERVLENYHNRDHLQATVETVETGIPGEPNLVDLVLKVEPGPKVGLKVSGTEKDKKYRRKLLALWKESIFPEEAPEEARARLERILRKEGYLNARVEVALPEDTRDKREVVLTAMPGARVEVEKVEITGNQNLETEELMKPLRSKPGRKGYLDLEEARVDSGRIRAKYLFSGYPDAKVPPPEVVLSPDGSRATLRFSITEGEPLRLKSIRVEGNTALSSEHLLKEFPLAAGDPYLRAKVRSGAEQIRMAYDRAGFPAAKISYELEGPGSAELVYRVDEGVRRYVGDVRVEGNLLTRDETMERELTFKPGDPLSREELLKSQRALYRLGIFQTVEFSEEPGTDPDRPVIRIRVSEADNLIQSVGAGYDSQEGIRGLYDLTNTNLFGRGRTFSLILRGSAIDSRAQVLLKDPFLLNRRLESLLTGYWAHQERESFTEEILGTTFQISRRHSKANRTFYRYTVKDVDVTDLQVSPAEAGIQTLRLSGPSFSFAHDTRDDFFNPRKGTFDSLDVGVVDNSLGSDVNFVRFYGLGSWFRKLGEEFVWAQAARVGIEVPYAPTDAVPISERFFAGGDTTVRGFDRDELGPKDPVTGEPLGGEGLIIINEELRFPIWRFMRGVVFMDAGNVTSTLSDLFPLRLRWVAGLGFRIDTPIGPFRLEYGWKLDREPGESPGEWNLSIGQAF